LEANETRAIVDRLNPPTSQLLELSWATVPFVLTMVMFFWGAAQLNLLENSIPGFKTVSQKLIKLIIDFGNLIWKNVCLSYLPNRS